MKPKYPSGIPYIIGNELAERFSYYGMKAILVVFMTEHLRASSGDLAVMSDAEAKAWYHLFGMANYFFPLLGALISDILWGKYRTIIFLSLVYCAGHLALAIDDTRLGLSVGLFLIALGAGGIKPCVSAHVGDQFNRNNVSLIEKTFGWFYFSINLGAAISSLLTPVLLHKFGAQVAFAVPGILMALATLCFWMGRTKFIAIPPVGFKKFKQNVFSSEGVGAIKRLVILYLFVSVFWSLFDQIGSSWILQAERMNRNINLGFTSFEVLPAQVQALNPILIMIFVPLFTYLIYPFFNKFIKVNQLRKIGVGLFLAAISFAVVAVAEQKLISGDEVGISWQLFAYLILTAAEVLVSITCLEFSYTQAPKALKSVIMALFLLSVSLGNAITALVNSVIAMPAFEALLEGARYYWFFVLLMLVVAVLYVPFSRLFTTQSYIHDS